MCTGHFSYDDWMPCLQSYEHIFQLLEHVLNTLKTQDRCASYIARLMRRSMHKHVKIIPFEEYWLVAKYLLCNYALRRRLFVNHVSFTAVLVLVLAELLTAFKYFCISWYIMDPCVTGSFLSFFCYFSWSSSRFYAAFTD